ncbi:hypothetical protein PENTCL1PPCAC_4020 [Pristionchus entomophagus]|uniref:Uncharacterized protein n=1 Tax=Pristionchus entomophagus TaxID=358040 RepID=A0AAV5SG40_9BILA|nr:hypothetical protein PENTCL1PPCAC_4020 [Pristionchus entomophagus]
MLIPLYHSHVLWSYGLRLKRCEDNLYAFTVKSVGSHLTYKPNRDGASNQPTRLSPPSPIRASLGIENERYMEIVSIKPLANGDLTSTKFTMEDLRRWSVSDGLLMRVCIVFDLSYFSLASIIDLETKSTVSEDARRVVETILRGEKPTG